MSSAATFERHLAALRARKALYAEAHPELGSMELRRSYWEQESCGRRGSERKEVAALIWLIKKSQPFWE